MCLRDLKLTDQRRLLRLNERYKGGREVTDRTILDRSLSDGGGVYLRQGFKLKISWESLMEERTVLTLT